MTTSPFNPQKVAFTDLLQQISLYKQDVNSQSDNQDILHLLFEACTVFLAKRLKLKKKDDLLKAKELLAAIQLLDCDLPCLFSDEHQILKITKLAQKNFGITIVVQQRAKNPHAIHDNNGKASLELAEEEATEEQEEEEQDQDFKDLHSSSEHTLTASHHQTMAQRADKYVLYQQSVQAAKQDVYLFEKIYKEHFSHQQATVFREDFCGTAWLCTEWIKRNKVENIAVGVDIDQEPIGWGLKNNISTLGSASDSVFIYTEDVLKFDWDKNLSKEAASHRQLLVTDDDDDNEEEGSETHNATVKKAHIVCAYNYSTCLLHERSQLLQYFANVRKSMSPNNSIFLLDIPGGAKLSNGQERTKKTPNSQVVYMFEQESYNPCTDVVKFNIHFKFTSDQSIMRRAFSFQFRKWGIREVIECMKQVGFSDVAIYWCTHTANDLEFRKLNLAEQRKLQQSDQWTALLCAIY